MELDQLIFKRVFDFYKNWRNKNSKIHSSRIVQLEEIRSRLTLISRALTGKNIDVLPAEKEGGWKGDVFYLPTSFFLLPSRTENLNYYIFRVVYLSIQSEASLNWKEKENIPSIEDSYKKAEESAPFILRRMEEDYPSIFQFYLSIKNHFGADSYPLYWLYGKFMVRNDVRKNNKNGEYDAGSLENKGNHPTTEIKSKPVEEVEILQVNKKAQDDYVLTHNFEKVETADEFSGVWRGFDGDDTLEQDAEALNELNLKHLVRTDEAVHSVYQAEFRNLINISESQDTEDEGAYLSYKEWDFSKNKYNLDYCKVFLEKTKNGDLNYANACLNANAKVLNELRRKFTQVYQRRRKAKKLPYGESIDIDVLVDWYTDIKSGRTPSENIYFSKRKKEPDLAILFLLDLSLSTDSYADGNRVLDVEKRAVILFGEVLNEYNIDFAVSGFFSKTRNKCSYLPLKGFQEDWKMGKQRLSTVSPMGYTRIGPALRHSKTLIENHPATQKWVILLSDGKPNDFDKYEGKYGLADVKQALREMHKCHINTYAIAVESVARYYLPQMFGQNHYNILSHPDMMISSLTSLYKRIINN